MKSLRLVFLFVCILGVSLNAQSLQSVGIHGFASQGYLKSSANNFMGSTKKGTFEFNEFGINFATELTDNLRVGMQIFARDLGYLGNGEVVIDWAFGDYRLYDWFGIRAGKMKLPLGLYSEIRDIDMLRTSILLPQGVYNESWRDTFTALKGIGIYGATPSTPAGTFNYQAQVGVLNMGPKTGLNKFIEDQTYASFTEYELETTYAGNLTWETPLNGLRLAASGYYNNFSIKGTSEDTEFWRNRTTEAIQDILRSMGIPDDQLPQTYSAAKAALNQAGVNFDLVGINLIQDIKKVKSYILSGEYSYRGLTLAGEFYRIMVDLRTSSEEYGELRGWSKNTTEGYYGSASYHIFDWLEAGTYYSEYYTDESDKDGTGYQKLYGFPASNGYLKDLALSLRFDINPHWIMKSEYHAINGTAVMFRRDQDNPHQMTKNWGLFAAKLTYSF